MCVCHRKRIDTFLAQPLTAESLAYLDVKLEEKKKELDNDNDSTNSADWDQQNGDDDQDLPYGNQYGALGGFGQVNAPNYDPYADAADYVGYGSGDDDDDGSSCCKQETFDTPPPFETCHCPPLSSDDCFSARCDCLSKHGLIICCVNGSFGLEGKCATILDQELKRAKDKGEQDNKRRNPNNKQRKRCYQIMAATLDYKTGRPLPACVVARVRRIWPDPNGQYMGYRET